MFSVCDVSVHITEGSVGSTLLTLLVEQANLKQSELDAHPVRSNMKQLLRSLDQLCPFEPDGDVARPDYVRSFFDYINTLASVLVRSLISEGKIIWHLLLHSTSLLHKAQVICYTNTYPVWLNCNCAIIHIFNLFCSPLDHSGEVKLGNPLLVLLQTPFQLLSHLLFDRQVSPDRYMSELHLIIMTML